MYDTPLTRPTTVGGLLGNVFRGTGQVAQAGGGVPLQNYLLGLLGPRSREMLAARRTSTPATTTIAPSPVSLLTPEMMSTQAPVGFDYVSPDPQLTKDQETRYSNYLLDNKVRDRPPQRTSALDEIERQPAPASGLLGRIGGGIRSAGKELGGLFEGDEGRARATALSRSFARGPSRTPISFGQSLTEGLAAGGEEIERMEQRKFAKEQRDAKKKALKMKADFEKEFSKAKTDEEQKAAVSKYLMKSNPLMYRRLQKAESYAQLKARVAKKVMEGEADPSEQKFYDDVIKNEAAYDFFRPMGGLPQAGGQVSNVPNAGRYTYEEVKP